MSESLTRTCHLCDKAIDSRVWYATISEGRRGFGRRKSKGPTRVYACPACFFESLDEDEREEYQRESLGGMFTRSTA